MRIAVVLVLPRRVRVRTVKQARRATVSGSGGSVLSPASRRRRPGIFPLLRSRTSPGPSFSVLSWRNGTERAAFLTRHSNWAPVAEKRPAVHGEEAAVGETELPGAEGAFELIGQGVLAVAVAADGRGLPLHGPGLQQRGNPQLRVLPSLGDAGLRRQFRAVEQVQGGAVEDDQLQAGRGPARGEGNVVPRGVELERPPCGLLAQPGTGQRERWPGRDRRARPDPRPGIENALARTMS